MVNPSKIGCWPCRSVLSAWPAAGLLGVDWQRACCQVVDQSKHGPPPPPPLPGQEIAHRRRHGWLASVVSALRISGAGRITLMPSPWQSLSCACPGWSIRYHTSAMLLTRTFTFQEMRDFVRLLLLLGFTSLAAGQIGKFTYFIFCMLWYCNYMHDNFDGIVFSIAERKARMSGQRLAKLETCIGSLAYS